MSSNEKNLHIPLSCGFFGSSSRAASSQELKPVLDFQESDSPVEPVKEQDHFRLAKEKVYAGMKGGVVRDVGIKQQAGNTEKRGERSHSPWCCSLFGIAKEHPFSQSYTALRRRSLVQKLCDLKERMKTLLGSGEDMIDLSEFERVRLLRVCKEIEGLVREEMNPETFNANNHPLLDQFYRIYQTMKLQETKIFHCSQRVEMHCSR